ncbi:MAG: lytic murein transglycosylase [Acidocella sp. 20-63-7]|nr:MAG: lytic murein transglycosylase [Acidocella sp. 20-63-7]HQT46470.1 lytic murein transglycosylase [Acidocella sp.]
MDRRAFLTGISLSLALPDFGYAADFSSFLAALRKRAVAEGLPRSVVERTTAHLHPNAQVLKLDQHQPEFTETWAEYSSHVLSATRIQAGREKLAEAGNLLAAVTSRFGVAASVLLGIWGLETNYGASQGDFDVIDALATLAWSRNSHFFAGQAISAMRIIARGDAPASRLTGSYAGAMGQPQFMPSVYLSTAVSFAGKGAPDIWHSDADSLASMANYLAKAGWRPGLPSSEPVLAAGINPAGTGRKSIRSLGAWRRLGVHRLPGAADLPEDTRAALLMPDGADGQAFLVYANFNVIRRYNASDYYALAVGALGRTVRNAA